MNLTPSEQKMIARLRKKQQTWRSGRWWFLIGGLVIVAMNLGALISIYKIEHADLAWTFLFLFSFPIILIGAGAGSAMIGISIRDWQRNTTDTLLLKLLGEQNSPR